MKRVTATVKNAAITPDNEVVAAPGKQTRFTTIPMPDAAATAVADACAETGMTDVTVTDA